MLTAGDTSPIKRNQFYMEITNEQLDKFLAGKCSVEEATIIGKYLDNHPEILQHYLKEEWSNANADYPLPENLSEEMYQNIRPKSGNITWLTWTAAAASVLIFITIGLFKKNDSNPATIASLQPAAQDSVIVFEKRNTTSKKEIITLPDGSVVHLFKNSVIRFKEGLKRELTLEGHASFEINKDEQHPFVVYAGATTTTVLGTSFNVAQDDSGVTVKLYTGKVAVKTGVLTKYLNPGQQLKYSVAKNEVAVSETKTKISNNNSFTSAPINEVLDALSARYKVPVKYNAKELEQIYFTGEILPTDSFMTIVQVMASMNGLTISQQNDTIIIRKH
jgi:transmembrane sensor